MFCHKYKKNPVDLRNLLWPWRCAVLKDYIMQPPPRRTLDVFTERELGRHAFKEVGMYIRIQNNVYDISG